MEKAPLEEFIIGRVYDRVDRSRVRDEREVKAGPDGVAVPAEGQAAWRSARIRGVAERAPTKRSMLPGSLE